MLCELGQPAEALPLFDEVLEHLSQANLPAAELSDFHFCRAFPRMHSSMLSLLLFVVVAHVIFSACVRVRKIVLSYTPTSRLFHCLFLLLFLQF